VVVAPCLFIGVAEQVKWFDRYIRAADASLQKRPEIFQTVGMYLAVNILDGVIHNAVLKLVQTLVRIEVIGVERGTGFDVLADFRLKLSSYPGFK